MQHVWSFLNIGSVSLVEEVKKPFALPEKDLFFSDKTLSNYHLPSLLDLTLPSARIWCSWLLLVPSKQIPSLLREGSTSSTTAGNNPLLLSCF
jgi:hypothetical protein